MLIFRRYELVFGFLLGIAVFCVGELLSSSSILQFSQTEQQQSSSHASSEESEKLSIDRRIARYTLWLVAFTGLLFVSTVFLWWSTRAAAIAAKSAAEHIPAVERGYIIGGGPWPGPESPQGFGYMSYGNYGKTPAVIKKIEWALCDEDIFPKDGIVSQLLDNKEFCKLLESKGVKIHIHEQEDVLRSGDGPRIVSKQIRFRYSEAAGKIFFGKFTFSILFDREVHFSTFKLKMTADGKDSLGLPGSYSDWK